MTEQTVAKCYLFVKYIGILEYVIHTLHPLMRPCASVAWGPLWDFAKIAQKAGSWQQNRDFNAIQPKSEI